MHSLSLERFEVETINFTDVWMGEVKLLSLLWIWLIVAPIYVVVEALLRNVVVPWLLERYCGSGYQKLTKGAGNKDLQEHTLAVIAER